MGGTSDPYVKVFIAKGGAHISKSDKPIYTTQVQEKRISPKWQEEFPLDPSQVHDDDDIVFQIFDKDRFTADDFLGEVRIVFATLKTYDATGKWLALKNEKGQPEDHTITGKLRVSVNH